MNEAEAVYSTQQVADRLGIGAAMMRRYLQTLERIRGQELPQTRRDGRQIGHAEVDLLVNAKALIDTHHGLSIEAALRMVLQGSVGETVAPILPSSTVGGEALIHALQAAYSEANAPILAELRELRAEVIALRERPQIDTGHESETKRMNRYLLRELERRRQEAELGGQHRPWWQRWRR